MSFFTFRLAKIKERELLSICIQISNNSLFVRAKGIEPIRLSAPDPKSGLSTNFNTPAKVFLNEKADFHLLYLVAGVGIEPHDLRVMSPTSYQLLYPAILDCKYTDIF